jgi:NTE family protein
VFVPFGKFVADENDKIDYDYEFDQYFISSASLIYETPIGPLSFGVNYYDRKEDPWSVLFNFGYLIYNKSIRE